MFVEHVWCKVSVGRWSDRAGARVPAVMVDVAVVRLMSMRLADMHCGRKSYLVGVVIVVLRLFSNMKVAKSLVCVSACRFRLKSSCRCMMVSG